MSTSRPYLNDDPDAFVHCDDRGIVRACTAQAAELLALDPDELVNRRFVDLPWSPADRRGEVLDTDRHPVTLALQGDGHAVGTLVDHAGANPVRVTVSPWLGPRADEVICRLAPADTPDPQDESHYSRAVLAAMAEGVVLRTMDGRYLTCNESAERILGLTRDQLTGREPTESGWRMIAEDGSPVSEDEVPTAVTLRTGEPVRNAILGVVKPTGTAWVASNTQPLQLPGEDRPWGVLSSFHDITPLKETQAALEVSLGMSQELNSLLEAKNDELERYAYTVAHDLKSPLVAVLGHLEFAEEAALQGNFVEMRQEMARIDAAAERMGELLDELLELSRLGSVVALDEPADLGRIVREALDLVDLRSDGRTVKVVVAPDLPVIPGDSLRLRQVVQNLLHNACKFTGDQPHPEVRVDAEIKGREVHLRVSDNGIGLEPDPDRDIFALFRTLGVKGSGSGIGLATVRRIIELHGGKVWAESEGKGLGTTFVLALPRGDDPDGLKSGTASG